MMLRPKYTYNTHGNMLRMLNISDNEKVFVRMEGEAIRYLYDNHLGSACLELDEYGYIISYEEYHPFGTTSYRAGRSATEVSWKRYKYCGKERDEETGLYYYGARYYAAWLCRFVSCDPLKEKYPSISPYAYCANNPIKYFDPDGKDWYETKDGQKVYSTDIQSQRKIQENNIEGKYLGKIFEDKSNNTYYSLFGTTETMNSVQGQLTAKIDDAFIKFADYIANFSSPDNYYIQDDPIQATSDFAGIIPFYQSILTTSENIHDYYKDEKFKYANAKNVRLNVSVENMRGGLESFSSANESKVYRGVMGLESMNLEGHHVYIGNANKRDIVVITFGDKENLNKFKNQFFKLFPKTKP